MVASIRVLRMHTTKTATIRIGGRATATAFIKFDEKMAVLIGNNDGDEKGEHGETQSRIVTAETHVVHPGTGVWPNRVLEFNCLQR